MIFLFEFFDSGHCGHRESESMVYVAEDLGLHRGDSPGALVDEQPAVAGDADAGDLGQAKDEVEDDMDYDNE